MNCKIRELRKSKNLSQEELAIISGVSRQAISYLENGGRDAMTKTLDKIAKALGTTVSALFFDDNV